MGRDNSQNQKQKWGFVKTLCVYLFLLYLGFVVADLALLQYVRPHFMATVTAKDVEQLNAGSEKLVGEFSDAEIGSKSSQTDRIVDRNIFNSMDMPEALANAKKDEELIEDDGDPVLSGLPLTLEGTAVHRNPFRSLATITHAGETKSYTVGDEVGGMAKIISVVRKKVIIRNLQSNRLEFIEITREQVQANRGRAPRPSRPSSSGDMSNLVQRDGNRFVAKRVDVNKQLSNVAALASQAKSRPATDPSTGELLGYEIYDIKKGSLFETLGIQNGDIVGSINGQRITNPAKAMSVFNQLKSASEINVNLNRGGREVELEYIIE